MSEQQKVRYGVLGLGRAGWQIHVAQLRDAPHAQIAAVADPLPERREEAKKEFGAAGYENLDELLQDDSVEVVVVATPSHCHAPDAIKALEAGKHVVTEKPMAVSLDEADKMIAAAKKNDRLLFVHHNYRFLRSFTYMEEVIKSGVLGELFHIRRYMAGFARRNDWQTLRKFGGGILANHGVHQLDQILQLTGAPVNQIMSDLRHLVAAGDAEDHCKVFMKCENGVTIDMEVTMAEALRDPLPDWILCGTTGTLTISKNEAYLKWFDPKEAEPLQVVEGPALKYGFNVPVPWQEKTETAEGPDVGRFYDNVNAVLREGQPMRVTPESAREVMRVISDIRRGTDFEE